MLLFSSRSQWFSLVVILGFLVNCFELTSGNHHLDDFTVKDDTQDLLAIPSDSVPVSVVVPPPDVIARHGPITQYIPSDEKAEESRNGAVYAYNPNRPRAQRRRIRIRPKQLQESASSQQVSGGYRGEGREDKISSSGHSRQTSPLLQHHPDLVGIDQYQKEQQVSSATPAVALAPAVPITGYSKSSLELQAEAIADDSLKEQQLIGSTIGSGVDIYQAAVHSPTKLLDNVFALFAKLSIPKEHYLNVISFVGVYLFMSILFYGSDEILQPKCEEPGGDYMHKEWHYHVGRRFVPGMRNVDEKMQRKFLELFRGLHLSEDDDDSSGGSSSSEEEVSGINQMCPREAFFYSLAPNHLEARMLVQRILVAQPSPAHVYRVAKDLLYRQKIHPKVWYLGLVAASLERPDMTGFKLAHPIDAIPDWFIPADLIKDEMDRYRAGGLHKRLRRSVLDGNSTVVDPPAAPSDSNATVIIPTTRRPLFSTTLRTSVNSASAESNSAESFVLDGASKKGEKNPDFAFFDDEVINKSVEKYQAINTKNSKYKPKKKDGASKKKNTSQQATSFNEIDSDSVENDENSASSSHSAPVSGPSPTLNLSPVKPPISVVDFSAFGGNNDLAQSDKHNNRNHGKRKNNRNKGHGKGKGKGKGKDRDSDEDDDHCIVVDGEIGEDNGIENRLWYYREDMMLNQHHWYWHLSHPLNATRHPDRRAELFFFTHRQFLARYQAERLSNGMYRMHPMDLLPGGILVEPYHSHLADVASGQYWTPRHPRRHLKDIHHEHNPDISRGIMLRDVSTIYRRIQKAVTFGVMISNKGLLSVRNTAGIEPLANTVEATELSVNPGIYDAFGLHNLGHLLIGLVEDPDWKVRKTPGVMSEVATAMRDPIFYPYHAVIDNIFEKNKESLTPYKVVGGEFPLLWKGVEVLDIEMMSKGNGPLNQLRTFWTKKRFELAPSVDRSTDRDNEHAKVCAVHLAHEPFTFKFTIERKPCAQSKSGRGTIRVFIAPRFDEKGRRLHLREQRRLMIQLDAFQAKLRVGRNIITRRSHDSSLTKPWSKNLHDYAEEGPDSSGAADFCGCGWPQHLYIPKGSPKGLPFDLFVMVTNYDDDHVDNDPRDLDVPETCNSPYLFCGHPRRRYPDARPMGYPFDRPPYKTPIPCISGYSFASVICKSFNLVFYKPIDTLEEFVARAPNMKSIVFDIKHINKLVGGYHRH